MAGPLPVKGTEISSTPCSVQRAAGLLRRFLSSEAGSEVGIAKGYIEAVAQSLEEMLARRRESSGNGTEELRSATAGRSSKFFNLEPVQKLPEIKKKKSRKEKEVKESKQKTDQAMVDFEALLGHELDGAEKKSRKEKEVKESKQKKTDQAMVDFEALLGHELDGAEAGEQANGELGFQEMPTVTEMLPNTPRQADNADDGRESRKKKNKRKSLDGAAMDVDIDEAAVDGDPDTTKSAKKKKKRKSVDGVLLSSVEVPAIERAVINPADDGRKKKKRHGATPVKEVVLTDHMNSSVGDRGRSGNDSEAQQGSAKRKSKKRASEESPVVKAFNF